MPTLSLVTDISTFPVSEVGTTLDRCIVRTTQETIFLKELVVVFSFQLFTVVVCDRYIGVIIVICIISMSDM